MKREAWRGGKVLGFLLGATGLGTEIFWVLYFSGQLNASESPQDHAHEKSFPVADTWMAACCFMAARDLTRNRDRGFFFGIAAGSALIFLAFMDILYSLENGKYWPLDADRATMAALNIWTLSLGIGTLKYLWKERGRFLA